MTLSWPSHQLTIEEWEALPEGLRVELAEGMLVMSPRLVPRHQRAGSQLASAVEQQLPVELITVADVEVVVTTSPLTIRAPDVIVTRTELYEANPPRFEAADILLAVEILSDGSRRIDRVLKSAEYAEAGIPRYWVLSVDGSITLSAFVLVDGEYEVAGEHTGTATLDVAGHPVTIDLSTLTQR